MLDSAEDKNGKKNSPHNNSSNDSDDEGLSSEDYGSISIKPAATERIKDMMPLSDDTRLLCTP